MKSTIRCWVVLVATLMPVAAVAQPAAAPPPITAVLATLTVKPGVDRTALLNTMPQEVSDTVKLYLDGKIQQWFGRGDGHSGRSSSGLLRNLKKSFTIRSSSE